MRSTKLLQEKDKVFHSGVGRIVGVYNIIAKDPETGIYILPITALKP